MKFLKTIRADFRERRIMNDLNYPNHAAHTERRGEIGNKNNFRHKLKKIAANPQLLRQSFSLSVFLPALCSKFLLFSLKELKPYQ